jgi:hypothetical protein
MVAMEIVVCPLHADPPAKTPPLCDTYRVVAAADEETATTATNTKIP